MKKINKPILIVIAILTILFSCGKNGSIMLLPISGIVNGGFEYGNPTGWETTGDARVIQEIDSLLPFEGRYMTLISTGIDTLYSYGQLSQSFHVKEDFSFLTFRYNILFEDFPNQMTEISPHTFRVSLHFKIEEEESATTETRTLAFLTAPAVAHLSNAVNDFPGTMLPLSGNLFQSTWMTSWQEMRVHIGTFQNQEVKIIFEAMGNENSTRRLAVLIDSVEVE